MSGARAGSGVSSLLGVRSPARARSPAEKTVGNYAVNNGLRERGSRVALGGCHPGLPPPPSQLPLHPPRPRWACSQPPAPPLEALLQPSPQPSSSSHLSKSKPPFLFPGSPPSPTRLEGLPSSSRTFLAQPELHHCSHLHLTEGPSPTRSSRHLGGTYLRVPALRVPGQEIIPKYSSQRASLVPQR